MPDRPQRLVFGEVAQDYDRHRPTYPDELFDLLLERTHATEVLDVGTGTGKAARTLAHRGLTGHAVEPSEEMAAVARQHLPATWTIEHSDFETCHAQGRDDWPLLTCAQAWHWIDHERGLVRAAELLRPGGLLGIFWNRPTFDDTPLRREMDEIYDRLAPDMPSSIRGRHTGTKGAELEDLAAEAAPDAFASVEHAELWWERRYTTAEWIGLLGTHSDHRLLDPAVRTELHGAIAATIEAHGGAFVLPYRVAVLLFTRSSV